MNCRHAAQEIVVGIKALSWLALGPLDLSLLQLGCNCAHHARGYLVLQIENILKFPIEAVRPEMRARQGIDELSGDAHPISRLAHTALEQVPHPPFASDLLHVDGPALIGEA